jgi:sugar/nucleoside kinase (ribokinase family)
MSPRVLLFDGHELEASRAALKAFPKAISILDAGSWREGTAGLAGQVNYLAASERFALQVTGLPHLDDEKNRRACVRHLRDRFSTIVVVTLGAAGLVADDGHGFQYLSAFPAEAVVTTGAGDIFHGALAYALAQEMLFDQSLRLAAMAASLSVRKPGGRQSTPALAEVREALSHVG